MPLFLSFCIFIAAVIAIFRTPFTPEWKKVAAQRKYDKCKRRAEALARAKLSQLKEEELASFDLYAYAVKLADQCGIRPDTATLVMERAGFCFSDSASTQQKRLQEYEAQASQQ